MGALEPPHLILILVLVLIIFGPGKLPQLGKAVGDGLRELKKATGDDSAATPTSADISAATPLAPAVPASWTCQRCHAVVPATDRFCGVCGAAREVPAAVGNRTPVL